MEGLSAVIITFNEENNIGRCLESIEDIVDEIIVMDSGSTDRTLQICKSRGVRVLQREWLGYSAQKNEAIKHTSYDYILSLDADEALSDALKKSILAEKEKAFPETGYTMNRLTQYCGQWIRHCGWYPDRKLRLWNKRAGEWKGRIHEKVELEKGATTHLSGDILHYSYLTVEENINRMIHYASLGAEELFAHGKQVSLLKLIISPCFTFFQKYILQLGFMDGWYGFVICKLAAQYKFYKYLLLREMCKNK